MSLREVLGKYPSGPALWQALQAETLPNSAIPALLLRLLGEQSHGATRRGGTEIHRGQYRYKIDELSCILPRGKQSLLFHDAEFVIRSNKAEIEVPYSAIRSILILDSLPNDTKGRVILYLDISPDVGIKNGKRPMNAVVLQTLASEQLHLTSHSTGSPNLSGVAAVVLCQLFGILGVSPEGFSSPDPSLFLSSKKKIGIEAHVKARPGTLIPMPGGLLFLEVPAIFIRKENIQGVEFARANGTSATFDVYVNVNEVGADGQNKSVVEFSALPKEDISALEAYIKSSRFSTSIDSDADASEERADQGEADDDSDEEDENYDPALPRTRASDYGERGYESEEESASSGEESSEESNSDDEAAELVSEDEFSMEALRKLSEKQSRHSGKRRRA